MKKKEQIDYLELMKGCASNALEYEQNYLKADKKDFEDEDLAGAAYSLSRNNATLGIYEYAIGNIAAAKQRFYNCAWLDVYNVTTHNHSLLNQGLHRPGYAILSDHEEIIQRYAKMRHVWRYIGRGDKEVVLSTEEEIAKARSVIWANTMQHFMANEDEMVERNLNVMEMKILSKKRVDGADRDCYQFFRFLLEQEKGKMEEVLEKIAKSKAYKIRGFDDPRYHFFAMPALGLAKLAWRRGIEVDVDNPLIPKVLLPIEPLEHYNTHPYELFLPY